jgi:hypothetical protein
VYTYNNGTYNKNNKVFAEVLHLPNNIIPDPITIDWKILNTDYREQFIERNTLKPAAPEKITIDRNILNAVNHVYKNNHDQILTQYKEKFLIVSLRYLPDHTKEVVYSNCYLNVRDDPVQYRLLKDNLGYYYDIFNYKTNEFDRFIEIPEAIKKIEQYMVDFLLDYKPNIVKVFSSSAEFVKYIDSKDIL